MSQSGMVERISALRRHHAVLIERAAERFRNGKESLAASDARAAAKISEALVDIDRSLGNLCADNRLLEWEPKR